MWDKFLSMNGQRALGSVEGSRQQTELNKVSVNTEQSALAAGHAIANS